MEEQWQVDRARLRRLRRDQPTWSQTRLAQQIGRSRSWVKKWLKRLAQADPADHQILKSQSRRPKQVGSPFEKAVIDRILAIRDEPPAGLNRTPGPVTIKYYLHQPQQQEEPLDGPVPRSTRTIWRILDEHQRIIRSTPGDKEPTEPAPPLAAWQLDFKDVTTVKPEPQIKRQHLVETLNIIDTGTSIVLDNPARQDFNAETVIRTLAEVLRRQGCPKQITFDRDPRFVASAGSGDFPAPFVRFLACLDIQADICPPQSPWKNGYVERYNRTYKYEGILIYHPETYEQVLDMNLDLRYHYNYQRPNQAKSCGNQPPRLAFPQLPPLPPPAETINPTGGSTPLTGICSTGGSRKPGPSKSINSGTMSGGPIRAAWWSCGLKRLANSLWLNSTPNRSRAYRSRACITDISHLRLMSISFVTKRFQPGGITSVSTRAIYL